MTLQSLWEIGFFLAWKIWETGPSVGSTLSRKIWSDMLLLNARIHSLCGQTIAEAREVVGHRQLSWSWACLPSWVLPDLSRGMLSTWLVSVYRLYLKRMKWATSLKIILNNLLYPITWLNILHKIINNINDGNIYHFSFTVVLQSLVITQLNKMFESMI